jgi:hypothetical protein
MAAEWTAVAPSRQQVRVQSLVNVWSSDVSTCHWPPDALYVTSVCLAAEQQTDNKQSHVFIHLFVVCLTRLSVADAV